LNSFNVFSALEEKKLQQEDFSTNKLDFIKKIQATLAKIKNDMVANKIDSVDNIIKPIKDLASNHISKNPDIEVFINMIVKKIEEGITDSLNYATDIKKIKSDILQLKSENQGIEDATNKLTFINNQISRLSDSKKHIANFNDDAFIELLGGDKSDNITFILNKPEIYVELLAIREKFKDLESIYNSYPSDCKKIVDSSFIGSNKTRSPFITIIKDLNEIVKKTQEIGQNLNELKELIKEVKKKGQLPYADAKSILSKIDSKQISSLYDNISKVIIRFKAFLRVEGFIEIFGRGQFDNALDVSKMDFSTADDIDNYYMKWQRLTI
jgi:hypothetical protein